jgi:ribose-phosphate pyrophosphokinase
MAENSLDAELRVFSGNAHPELAEAICRELGVQLGQAEVSRFPDGETKVRVIDDVRGRDVFVVQPTSPPVNDHLVELLVLIDAFRRSSAQRITAVIPYFGYARQDRKHEGRVPITAKLVSNLICTAGANRVICMDLHAGQIQGFFDIPVDHLYAWPVMLEHIRSLNLQDLTILSPDPGRLKLAHSFAKRLHGELAVIDKRRVGDSEVEKGEVVGEIRGRNVLIVDDMITTGGSMFQAVQTARQFGARDVYAMATHAVFCGRVFERFNALPVSELAVCDTIPVKKLPENVNFVVLSVGKLLAQAIRRTHFGESISVLFV